MELYKSLILHYLNVLSYILAWWCKPSSKTFKILIQTHKIAFPLLIIS